VITMNQNKTLWEKGDFTRIAASMRESGDALVQSLDVRPGLEVLDVGSGDGTTAFPAARLRPPCAVFLRAPSCHRF